MKYMGDEKSLYGLGGSSGLHNSESHHLKLVKKINHLICIFA